MDRLGLDGMPAGPAGNARIQNARMLECWNARNANAGKCLKNEQINIIVVYGEYILFQYFNNY